MYMFNKSLVFLGVVLISSLTFAQQIMSEQRMDGMSSSGNATTTCNVTFSSGSGHNTTQFCVTVNGNITQFSRDGQEMINFGSPVGEGYGICDQTGGTRYYDYAYEDSGNWLSPTFTHSGNVVSVTRTTSDGLFKLKQTITNVPATTSSAAAAKMKLAITNLSNTARFVILIRYANVNAAGSIPNDFEWTPDSVFGLRPSGFGGLSLTSSSVSVPFHSGLVNKVPDGPDPCQQIFSVNFFEGDGSIEFFYHMLPLAAHATKTVVMTYKPF